jgi:guanylate kinase
MKPGKIIIITAPSGSGKTTLVRRLLAANPELAFSVSACTRPPRDGETDGKDYYFYSVEKFKQLIEEDAFVEWEMVYAGKYYGTLKSEMERIWKEGKYPLVDIDVKGALAIHDVYPDNSLSIFIEAPSLEALKLRLLRRGTESDESLKERVDKAAYELTFAPRFNHIIINDDIDVATKELTTVVEQFLHAS